MTPSHHPISSTSYSKFYTSHLRSPGPGYLYLGIMHFRVRRSEKYLPKHDIFVIGIDKEEEADPNIQRLWDDEQLQAEKVMQRDSSGFSKNTLFYMKNSGKTVLTSFIVEFIDLNCKYMFVISDGVGQWLYEHGPARDVPQENEQGVISIQHKAFREALVPVTAEMHNNLMCLLRDGGGVSSNWVLCHWPTSHSHHFVNISLGPDYRGDQIGEELRDQHFPSMGYTTYLVCWNARLVDFFDAFCGGKTHQKDEILLTHILPGRTYGGVRLARAGNTYSYRKARIEQVLMADVNWRVHGDGRMWVMPS